MILPAVAIAFHGCDVEVGERILASKEEIRPSTNSYDWLGTGAYFWEGDPHRALSWATFLKNNSAVARTRIKTPFAIGAIINLGACLDLTHSAHLQIVQAAHREMEETFRRADRPIPQNKPTGKGDHDLIWRYLDCAVFNYIHETRRDAKSPPFDTVRASFPEGEPLYSGAKITRRSHVQICVRNHRSIVGYFRPLMDRYS